MQDIYLFRGFYKDENGTEKIYLNGEEIKGKWVYGYLVEYTYKDTVYMNGTSPKISYIFPMDERSQLKCLEKRIEVIPETVGQYTGLDDKNGNKIFKNDVVVCSRWSEFKWYVTFIEGSYYLHDVDGNRCISFSEVVDRIKGNIQGNIEVIGTIFDENETK